MKRTIIGLWEEPPDSIESNHDDEDLSVQVEDVQQDLDGRDVYHGRAASRVEREERVASIDPETGEIDVSNEDVERVLSTEFVATLADDAFVLVDSSEGEFLFDVFGLNYGGKVRRASYSVDRFADRIRNQYDATFWGVNWSEGEDHPSGAYFPGYGEDDAGIVERAMTYEKPQVGWSYVRGGEVYRGTMAASGYLLASELGDDEFEFPDLVAWIREEALPHAYRGDA